MTRILSVLAFIAGLAAPEALANASDSASTRGAGPQRLDPGEHWQKLEPDSATFQIELPGTPEYSQQVHSTWVGSIVEQRWALERPDVHLEVLRYELPFVPTLILSDASLIRRARDSLLEDRSARQLSWEPMQISDHPGWTLRFEGPDSGASTEEARFLLAGRALYILDASTKASGGETPAARFFNSFRLR